MGFFDGFGDSLGSLVGGALGGLGSIAGGAISATNSQKVAQMNIDAQREFAQNGVRWRVADAKAAGVHPSIALGMSGASFTPVSGYTGDYGISDAAQQFGQGISRAVQVKMTKEEREREIARQEMQDTFQLAMMNRQVKYQDAQIDLMNSEIARNKVASYIALMRANPTPAMPSVGERSFIDGQGNAPTYSNTTVGGSNPLLSLSRVGNLLVEHINPDLSDSVTESLFKSAGSYISAEGQAGRTYHEAIKALSPREREYVKQGKAGLVRIPGVGWQFQLSSDLAPRRSSDGRSVSGKLIFLNNY